MNYMTCATCLSITHTQLCCQGEVLILSNLFLIELHLCYLKLLLMYHQRIFLLELMELQFSLCSHLHQCFLRENPLLLEILQWCQLLKLLQLQLVVHAIPLRQNNTLQVQIINFVNKHYKTLIQRITMELWKDVRSF